MLRSQLDTLTQTFVINRPEVGKEEVPVFPMSAAEQARVIPLNVRRCPFCSNRMKPHMHKIREWQYEGKSPKFILAMLKRKNAAPNDPNTGDVVMSAKRFDEMLGVHMIHCEIQSHANYSTHWRRIQDEKAAHRELQERFAEIRGYADGFEALDDAKFTASDIEVFDQNNGRSPAQYVNLGVEDMALQEMMSEILISHVQCVLIEHRKYMQDVKDGFNPNPPSLDGLNKVLTSFGKLFGDFQVSELMDKIPGIKGILDQAA